MEFNKKLNINISSKKFDISADKEYIDIEGYASKMYEADGTPKVDLDSENVNTTNFKLEAKRLLLNHDMEEPVGDLELSHKPDGIWIKARAYKDTMSEKEFNRLRRGLYDFSIGFIPTEAEYISVKGKDVLSFTAGSIYEVSLVSIPSNTLTTIDVMKSVKNTNGCVGLQCNISDLKAMNPNEDCSCLADLKKEKIEMENMEKNIKQPQTFDRKQFAEAVSKGLTIQETMNEPWNISDSFWNMFGYFNQTIRDNYDSFRWEDLSKEEMLTNLDSAFEVFKNTITEVADKINAVNAQETVDNMDSAVKSLEGDKIEMKTKSVENVEVENTETVEGTEQTETTEETTVVAEEQSEKTETKEVVKENLKSEEETSEDTSVGEAIKADETTIKDDSAVEAEPLDVNKEVIAILSADLDKLEAEDIQSLYDTLADKLGDLYSAHEALNKIEAYVKENV